MTSPEYERLPEYIASILDLATDSILDAVRQFEEPGGTSAAREFLLKSRIHSVLRDQVGYVWAAEAKDIIDVIAALNARKGTP